MIRKLYFTPFSSESIKLDDGTGRDFAITTVRYQQDTADPEKKITGDFYFTDAEARMLPESDATIEIIHRTSLGTLKKTTIKKVNITGPGEQQRLQLFEGVLDSMVTIEEAKPDPIDEEPLPPGPMGMPWGSPP